MPMHRSVCSFAAPYVLAIISLAASDPATAQLPTTVQLPSFSFFSYSGTVVVPDGGGTSLGGIRSSATGMNRRGLSRGFGSSQFSSQASVHATIIDLNEIDRQLLGGTPQEFLGSKSNTKRARNPVDPTAEGKALVRYARKQYREGNHTASFDTYRMAIRILPTGLRELATKEFERVFGASATQAVRMSSLRR